MRATRAIALDLTPFEAVRDWFDRISARPAVIAGTAVANAPNLSRLRPDLTPEQWSKLFGANMLAAV